MERFSTPLFLRSCALVMAALGSPALAKSQVVGGSATVESCERRDGIYGLIYLHGLDPSKPSAQELGNRKLLSSLSKKFGLSFAVVRSKKQCRGQNLCWQAGTRAEMEASYRAIIHASRQCLPSKKKLVALGFSNGGYLLNKLVMNCVPHEFAEIVTVGAAGRQPPKMKADLGTCGSLTLMIGEKDQVFKKVLGLDRSLKQRKAKVKLKTFRGGHQLPEKELGEFLWRVVAPRP